MQKKEKALTFRAPEGTLAALFVESESFNLSLIFDELIKDFQVNKKLVLNNHFKSFSEFISFDLFAEEKILIKLDSSGYLKKKFKEKFFYDFIEVLNQTFEEFKKIEFTKGNDFYNGNKKDIQRFKSFRYRQTTPFNYKGFVYNEKRKH